MVWSARFEWCCSNSIHRQHPSLPNLFDCWRVRTELITMRKANTAYVPKKNKVLLLPDLLLAVDA